MSSRAGPSDTVSSCGTSTQRGRANLRAFRKLDIGALVIFDRRPDAAPVYERTAITEEHSPTDRTIMLLRV